MSDEHNWWVHRFRSGTVWTFKVDHEESHAGQSEEYLRRPDNASGYPNIEIAEVTLGAWGSPSGNSNWYIHRVGSTGSPVRWYEINHAPYSPGTTHCPAGETGYTNVAQIAADTRLSRLDLMPSDETCPT